MVNISVRRVRAVNYARAKNVVDCCGDELGLQYFLENALKLGPDF